MSLQDFVNRQTNVPKDAFEELFYQLASLLSRDNDVRYCDFDYNSVNYLAINPLSRNNDDMNIEFVLGMQRYVSFKKGIAGYKVPAYFTLQMLRDMTICKDLNDIVTMLREGGVEYNMTLHDFSDGKNVQVSLRYAIEYTDKLTAAFLAGEYRAFNELVAHNRDALLIAGRNQFGSAMC